MGEMCRMWGFLCTWKYENNYLSMFSCNTARAISLLERKYNFLGTAGGTWQSSWVSFDSYKIPFFGFGKRVISAVTAPGLAGRCPSPAGPAAASLACDKEELVACGSTGWCGCTGNRGNTAQLSSARVAVHRDGCSWLRQAIRSGCRVWLIQ